MSNVLVLPAQIKRIVWISYNNYVLEFVQAAVACLRELKVPVELWTQTGWPGISVLRDPTILFIITRGMDLQKCPILPQHFIVHQVEQCKSAALGNPNSFYVAVLRRALAVWDYSKLNVAHLRQLGISQIGMLEFSFHPALIFEPRDLIDMSTYDVLFIGQPCQRRNLILNQFRAAGISVRLESKVFGPEKASLIRNAKIILNLHFYVNPAILETERLALLLANRKCVVSETSSEIEVDQEYSSAVVFESKPENLIQRCKELLENDNLRQEQELAAFKWFSTNKKLVNCWHDLDMIVSKLST